MTSTRPLSAVVVGAGAGGFLAIDGLMASTRYQLIGVADLGAQARSRVEARTGVPTFASHEDLFAQCPADVVCVSTYAPTHLPITEAALDIPGLKGLLVEKPLGDTAQAGHQLLDLIRSRGLPVAVPHGLMSLSAPLQLIEEVRSGAIGKLRLVEIECRGWDTINAGIHWLQFFVALAGDDPVESVLNAADASSRTFRDGMQVETEAIMVARCASGLRCMMHIGDEIPISRPDTTALFRIIGDNGFIEYGAYEDSYVKVAHGANREVVRPEPFSVTGHQSHLERLADQILESRTDYALADSSLRALEIVEAAYLSNRIGGLVTMPLDKFVQPEPSDWDPGVAYSGVGGGRNGREL
ncbi:Gfo/Idh/MocA family protein [Aeromicrobium sp. P5_D10]